MAAAIGRIVVQDQVALVDVVAEERGDRLHRRDQRAEMDRDVLALQDHLRPGVEQRGRIVVRQVEDARARGLLQRQRHLALRRLEHAAHHGQGDRIDLGYDCWFIVSSLFGENPTAKGRRQHGRAGPDLAGVFRTVSGTQATRCCSRRSLQLAHDELTWNARLTLRIAFGRCEP